MERRGDFDIDAPLHKFCVSWFTLQVAQKGTTLFVQSWNEHPIPSKYIKLSFCTWVLLHE